MWTGWTGTGLVPCHAPATAFLPAPAALCTKGRPISSSKAPVLHRQEALSEPYPQAASPPGPLTSCRVGLFPRPWCACAEMGRHLPVFPPWHACRPEPVATPHLAIGCGVGVLNGNFSLSLPQRHYHQPSPPPGRIFPDTQHSPFPAVP